MRLAWVGLRRLPEEDLREEPREADGDEVDHDAGHDVVDTERDRRERMDPGEQHAAQGAEQQAHRRPPRQAPPEFGGEVVGTERAGHRTDDHQSLETDVHDAGPLAEQTAEAGQVDDREVGERDADRRAEVRQVHQRSPSARTTSAGGAATSSSSCSSAPARCN
jgi:hypothetical protein